MQVCKIINGKNSGIEKKELLSEILFVAKTLAVIIVMYVFITTVTAGIINRL